MRPINLVRLSPRRAYAVGLMRAKRQARKQMHAMATDFDAELLALRDEFDALAVAHHQQCRNAAVSEAMIQRALDPNMLMH